MSKNYPPGKPKSKQLVKFSRTTCTTEDLDEIGYYSASIISAPISSITMGLKDSILGVATEVEESFKKKSLGTAILILPITIAYGFGSGFINGLIAGPVFVYNLFRTQKKASIEADRKTKERNTTTHHSSVTIEILDDNYNMPAIAVLPSLLQKKESKQHTARNVIQKEDKKNDGRIAKHIPTTFKLPQNPSERQSQNLNYDKYIFSNHPIKTLQVTKKPANRYTSPTAMTRTRLTKQAQEHHLKQLVVQQLKEYLTPYHGFPTQLHDLNHKINNIWQTIGQQMTQVYSKLTNLSNQVTPLNDIQQHEKSILRRHMKILRDPHYGNYYHYFQTLFSSAYIGAYAIMSGTVEVRASTRGAMGDVVGSVLAQIPIIGVAGTVLKAIIRQLDQRHITQSMHNITKLANNITEADAIIEQLAYKAIYLQYKTLQQTSVKKMLSYKKRIENWYEGTPNINQIENKAAQDVQVILLKLAQNNINLPERIHSNLQDHAEYMASFILDATLPKQKLLRDINLKEQKTVPPYLSTAPYSSEPLSNPPLSAIRCAPAEAATKSSRNTEIFIRTAPCSSASSSLATEIIKKGKRSKFGSTNYHVNMLEMGAPLPPSKCCLIM